MAEEVKQQQQQPEQKQPEQKKPDLVTRVSQYKAEQEKKEESKQTEENFGLTKEDFDKVQNDPTLSKFYKSMQSDYTRKTQALASERQAMEKLQGAQGTWNRERIQGLLNDPDFVKAAQEVAASQAPANFEGTQEEWSALSEGDKAKFKQLEEKISLLEQQNYQTHKMQQDETLKGKYNNYDGQAVDILTNDMLQGKVQATREHIWKVLDYDSAVERAYKLGLQDGNGNIQEKATASSPEGFTMTQSKEKPSPEKGESDRNFFKRIALSNLMKSKEATIRK